MGRCRRDNSGGVLLGLIYVLLVILIMPFVGLWMLGNERVGIKILGGILIVLGVSLWIFLGTNVW